MRDTYNGSFIGETVKILVEEIIEEDGETYALGLTERYVQVKACGVECPYANQYINQILSVRIESILKDGILLGKVQKNT